MKKFLSAVIALAMVMSLMIPGVNVTAQETEDVAVIQPESGDDDVIWSGDWYYEMYGTDTIKLVGTVDYFNNRSMYIPTEIDGYTVVALGEGMLDIIYALGTLYIPETVTEIEEGAFCQCVIDEIRLDANNTAFVTCFPEPVTNVKGETYYSSTSAKDALFTADGKRMIRYAAGNSQDSYEIPSCVESIDEYAFYGANLKSITMPDGITEIRENTFLNASIGELSIPEGVTTIRDNAFCRGSVTELDLPSTITTIEGNPFYEGDVGIINIAAGADCEMKDNMLLYKNGTVAVKYFPYLKGEEPASVYEIPDGVITIERGALHNVELEELIVAGTVRNIADDATWALRVKKVVFKDGFTKISDYMFQDNSTIEEITIPVSLKEIGYRAFVNVYNLDDIYYAGSDSSWDEIVIDESNEELLHLIADAGEYGGVVLHLQGVAGPDISGEVIDEGVKLTWEKVENATSYKIYRADTTEGKKTLIAKTSNTSYTDINVEKEKTYYYYAVSCGSAQSHYSAAAQVYVLNDLERFVARLYTIALNRDVDPTGYADWVGGLESGKYDGAAVGRGIFLSDEFVRFGLSDDEFLNRLYHTFFNREPDTLGVANWKNHLNAGYSREFILSHFVNSEEFMNLCRDFGIERGVLLEDGNVVAVGLSKFVSRLYSKVLGRTPDWTGYTDWVTKLATGKMDATTVAASFFGSQEYLNKNTSNDEYVTTLYATFFDRNPDEGGYAEWMAKLAAGEERSKLISGFSGSQEFLRLLASFGL